MKAGWRVITRCSKPSNCSFRPKPSWPRSANRLFTYVQLYRVLGGGWTLTDAQWSGPQAQRQGP